jgi:predicted MFS family arabinose efflux permease
MGGVNTPSSGRSSPAGGIDPATAAGYVLDGLGDWIYSLALVVLAYQLTGRLAVAAAALLFQATGRLAGMALYDLVTLERARALAVGAGIFRAALFASLIAVTARDRLWIAMAVAALVGISGPLAEVARRTADPLSSPAYHSHNLATRLVRRWDQLTMIAGAVAGGLLIVAWSERAAFAVAAILVMVGLLPLLRPRSRAAFAMPFSGTKSQPDWSVLRTMATVRAVVLAFAGVAALGIAIRVILVEVVLDRHGDDELMYGLFVALAGAGAFAGPLSVPRLLAKIPPQMVLAGLLGALALAVVALCVFDPPALLVPVILGCGVAAITAERVAETVTRRLVPDQQLDGALRLVAVTVVAGQALALAAVVVLDRTSGLNAVAVGLTGCSILLAGFALLSYVGGVRARGRALAGGAGQIQTAAAADD